MDGVAAMEKSSGLPKVNIDFLWKSKGLDEEPSFESNLFKITLEQLNAAFVFRQSDARSSAELVKRQYLARARKDKIAARKVDAIQAVIDAYDGRQLSNDTGDKANPCPGPTPEAAVKHRRIESVRYLYDRGKLTNDQFSAASEIAQVFEALTIQLQAKIGKMEAAGRPPKHSAPTVRDHIGNDKIADWYLSRYLPWARAINDTVMWVCENCQVAGFPGHGDTRCLCGKGPKRVYTLRLDVITEVVCLSKPLDETRRYLGMRYQTAERYLIGGLDLYARMKRRAG